MKLVLIISCPFSSNSDLLHLSKRRTQRGHSGNEHVGGGGLVLESKAFHR